MRPPEDVDIENERAPRPASRNTTKPAAYSMKTIVSSLEPLEARIAPAAFVTYTDVDGDLVKITASTGPLDLADLTLAGGDAGILQRFNLTAAGFDGAKITFTVTKKLPGGDGLANVGFIDATGRDLDAVIVKGDLARIIAGDAVTADDPGLNLLSVRSLGTLGLATGAANLQSKITGGLGALVVGKDFTEAYLEVASGGIGSVKIGGDILGGRTFRAGTIFSVGSIGPITIGGSVVGGQITESGFIYSGGSIGAVKLGGSLGGGGSPDSGEIRAVGSMGAVTLGGSLIGGSSIATGTIHAGTTLGLVKIKGSVLGASGQNSGLIRSDGDLAGVQIGGDLAGGSTGGAGSISCGADIGPVKIGGNLIGGKPEFDGGVAGAGAIFSSGRIASVAIRGAIFAAHHTGAGATAFCGSIRCGDDLGSLSVGKGIFGDEIAPIIISAGGEAVKPVSGDDLTIGKITIKGDVRFARILAGFDTSQAAFNADASIGPVSVSGDWVASSLVAGAQDAGTPGFGEGDIVQAVGNTALISRIASVTIRGDITGSLTTGDRFGFVAQQIDKFRSAGRSAVLTPGKTNNAFFFDHTNDVALLEV